MTATTLEQAARVAADTLDRVVKCRQAEEPVGASIVAAVAAGLRAQLALEPERQRVVREMIDAVKWLPCRQCGLRMMEGPCSDRRPGSTEVIRTMHGEVYEALASARKIGWTP